jgi:hypothetical protein
LKNKNELLTPEARLAGLSLVEDDHILSLVLNGKTIARFSATGVEVANILQEVENSYKN